LADVLVLIPVSIAWIPARCMRSRLPLCLASSPISCVDSHHAAGTAALPRWSIQPEAGPLPRLVRFAAPSVEPALSDWRRRPWL